MIQPETPRTVIAVARLLRTLGLRGRGGCRPQPGVLPLHPFLSLVTVAALETLRPDTMANFSLD